MEQSRPGYHAVWNKQREVMGHFSHENVPAGTPMHKCMQDTDFFIQVAFQNVPLTKQVTTGIDHTRTC